MTESQTCERCGGPLPECTMNGKVALVAKRPTGFGVNTSEGQIAISPGPKR
jgi:hypothetical protein